MSFDAGGPFSLMDTAAKRKLADGQSPAGAAFWAENPEAWDVLVINKTPLPGLSLVTGGIDMRVDTKKVSGKHGASHTFHGNDPAKIEITTQMWMPEHLTAFEKMVPILKPRKARPAVTVSTNEVVFTSRGGVATPQVTSRSGVLSVSITSRNGQAPSTPTSAGTTYFEELPVDVYHPALALYGIRSMIVLHLGLLEMTGPGVYTLKMHAEEFIVGSKRDAGTGTQKSSSIVGTFGGKTARDVAAKNKPSLTITGPR